MTSVHLRPPVDGDWPAILALANESVANVPGAGPQDAWLANRRQSGRSRGLQRHWVLLDPAPGAVKGYVAIEAPTGEADAFRLFVITDPAQRTTLGVRLLNHALSELRQLHAKTAYFVEYADDTEFVAFLGKHGFSESGSRTLEDGARIATLSMRLDSAGG